MTGPNRQSAYLQRIPAAGALSAGLLVLTLGGLGSCSGGGGGGGGPPSQSGIPGQEENKPGGGTFFVDPNSSGRASRLVLGEMVWGRLADIHDVDANGATNAQPLFRDFVVNENIQSDGSNYRLETNPITQGTRLVILRERQTQRSAFDSLFAAARSGLPPIVPKNDDGSSSGPFSFIARNACLMLRFEDCLNDTPLAEQELIDTVKVLTGYPPSTPFSSRMFFDPNHGALVSGQFHSTRVVIDMTVSEAEAGQMVVPAPINSLGLPASLGSTNLPNASVHIPTRIHFPSGQFKLLRNLAGAPLSPTQNGPTASNPTEDVVRAMRSGNSADTNNGFLLDLNSPELLGGWPVQLNTIQPDPAGLPGFDFVVDLQYLTPCQTELEPGDIVTVGGAFTEVTELSSAPLGGVVLGVRIRVLAVNPVTNPSVLLGSGLFLSTLDPNLNVPTGCWISFTPQPDTLPATGVSTQAQSLLRFSEPMDPVTLSPFDSFLVIRGDSGVATEAENIVVGKVLSSPDLKEFTFTPLLPFKHEAGLMDGYHVILGDATDLAGNGLKNSVAAIDFTLDANDPPESNGGVVLRFESTDEVKPLGFQDLRGQIFYDLNRALIRPRPVTFESFPADRSNPVPAIMIPFTRGIQTPLSPLGSKLQTVWRYCDLGWQVRDETKYNMDVYGLNWSPIAGLVLSDFYEEFEIRLSHSVRQPDEDIDQNQLLPKFPASGLAGSPSFFTENILNDPLSPQKVMHPRSLGYVINPSDLFRTPTGTFLMPYPLNQQASIGTLVTYTWRDTAVLKLGAPGGLGIPLGIEVGAPLLLEPAAGVVAPDGQVPSFGLPLLMEYRCYPSDSGVGLNAIDISIAVNNSARPNFRAYSTGGINTSGQPVLVDPDLELVPSGGFNPLSSPPGRRTTFDASCEFYIGQLDTVIRVSRAHTVWIDTLAPTPVFVDPVVDPDPALQPLGTQIIIDYRGALGFTTTVATDPFDALKIDPYGNAIRDPQNTIFPLFTVNFFGGQEAWTSDIRDISGARYVQMRLTFLNNIGTMLNAELSAIGVAFLEQ